MSQDILLHCHFFKNAGSTIDWALRRSFGTGFYENKEHFYSVLEWNNHLERLLEKQIITALSTHIFSLRPPKIDGVQFWLLAMVRHPIERVTSVAAFEKKQKYRNTFGTIADSAIGIQGYVEAFLRDGTPASIRNIHTLRFAGRDNGYPVSDDDFARAIRTLEQCPTIGMVEFFDESMVLFEEVLQTRFPQLDLAYIIQNVHQTPQGIGERILKLQTELGEDLFGRLLSKNAMDMRFYDLVKQIFHERIGAVPDFPLKLEKFRNRCREIEQKEQSGHV